jgi:hypothetical protein
MKLKSSRTFLKVLLTISILSYTLSSNAQSPFKGLENLFTTPDNYIVQYTKTPPIIDGDINDAAWNQAKWTNEFQDIEGDKRPAPTYKTQVKMLWDDSCLYIMAKMEEPNVWGYETKHDAVIYHENDFEVFVNPDNTIHNYYEFEVNPLNTIFDLFLERSYRDGGQAMINWNAEGLRSAVKIQGTINNPADTDKGWTVEMAIPFKSISIGNDVHIPGDGDLWRIDFSRVEWDTQLRNGKYVKQTTADGEWKPEHNWVWSPPGLISMHYPERWGYLKFSKGDNSNNVFTMPYPELQKRYLWLIYYREQLYFRENHTYALNLKDLGVDSTALLSGTLNNLKLEATEHQFLGFITDGHDNITWCINQQGAVNQLRIRK